ncbi:MAG: HAMP domain-containing histidine kinase [Elusimicrobia bacterium]|nr:HAMP domain-containing histidine kinase [Elusimicrobiota bacterium]
MELLYESFLYLVSTAVLAILLWWVIRFRRILPLEKALRLGERDLSRLQEMLRQLSEHLRLPASPAVFKDSLKHFGDELHRSHPRIKIFLFFEERDEPWVLLTQWGFQGTGFRSYWLKPGEGVLGRAVLSGRQTTLSVDRLLEEDPEILEICRLEKVETLGLLPFISEGEVWGLLGILGSHSDIGSCFPSFHFWSNTLSQLYGNAGTYWSLVGVKKDLERGVSATIQELTDTNARLIQRAREMKTLYEVASAMTSQPKLQANLSAIVSIVAKALSADLCAFLLYDEKAQELVTQHGAYGIANDETSLYRIPVANRQSSSVRVFLNGQPFMTQDALRDPSVISHFASLWRVRSLMVVPLKVENRRIGVLRIGSFSPGVFGEDHLQVASMIADEAAVIVDHAVLYARLSENAMELKRLNHLKDEFISTISHELKTPLTTIKGFLALLLQGEAGRLEGLQRQFLTIADNASDRLDLLISDLLDISSLESQELRMELVPVSLEEVIAREMKDYAARAKEKHLTFRSDLPGSLPMVQADPKWMGRVLDNLLSNAVKFTPPGGRIGLIAQNKGDFMQVTVSDTGIGVGPRELQHIFEKFYQVRGGSRQGSPGTGLGLAIAKSVVEKHGGRIWAESEAGAGTSIHFVLPFVKSIPLSAKKKTTGGLKS